MVKKVPVNYFSKVEFKKIVFYFKNVSLLKSILSKSKGEIKLITFRLSCNDCNTTKIDKTARKLNTHVSEHIRYPDKPIQHTLF